MARTTRFWLASLLAAATGSPAVADRHCYPALDDYFGIRAELLAEDVPCAERRAGALERMESLGIDAQICGCTELIQLFQDLAKIAADTGLDCQTSLKSLLDAEEIAKETVRDCH